MSLPVIQQSILKMVVERFVNSKQATERIVLVREFEDPDAIDELYRWQFLKTFDSANYLPTAFSGRDSIPARERMVKSITP